MGELSKIISLILLSSVKFVLGPPFAYLDPNHNFSHLEIIVYCVSGGMLGVVTFTFFSKPVLKGWEYLVRTTKNLFRKPGPFSEPMNDLTPELQVNYVYLEPRKKLFTRKNRKLVRVLRQYGLIGIVAITPVILSIPIGTVLANKLESKKAKIFLLMFISIVFWSVVLTSFFEFFHSNQTLPGQNQAHLF